jgi:hypothetical protein
MPAMFSVNKSSKVFLFVFLMLSMYFFLMPSLLSFAADANTSGQDSNTTGSDPNPGQPAGSITNPLKVTSIEGFLVAVIEILLVFAIPIIVLYIMYAGFLFVTAGGESSQHEKARNALFFALIGGVIILGAFLIIDIIKGTVDGLKNG